MMSSSEGMETEYSLYVLYKGRYGCSKVSVAVLVGILVVILDFSVIINTYFIFNSINEILDLKNILLDTRIIFLCAILMELWLFEGFGSHFGGHLGFWCDHGHLSYFQQHK